MSSSSLQELDAFHRFARGRLSDSTQECSLEDCLRERRERDETIADVMQGRRDYEAGLFVSVDDAFDRIHRELGIPQ